MKSILCVAALGLAVLAGTAEAAYPERPITIVVTSAAGGITDALARALAPRLATLLKGQIIVENRGGGRNVVGTVAVVNAPADGLTLLVTDDSTLTLNPLLMSSLPYKVPASFTPIALLVSNPQCLVVGSSVKADGLSGFLEAAKAKPGSMSFATPGQGTASQMHFLNLQSLTHTKLQDIPYRGAAPALTDIMGGQVDAMIVSSGLVVPFVKSGKLKVLAQAGPNRSFLLPEVPTFAESGIAGFSPHSWFALLAPAGVPPSIAARLNQAVNAIIADPTFKTGVLTQLSLEPLGGTSEQLLNAIHVDSQRWTALVHQANIKIE